LRHIGCVFVSVILIVVSLFFLSCKQQSSSPDAYTYPTTPGGQEWSKFTSHDEMVAAVQIPTVTLSSMSTAGLVESVLNYPMFGDVSAYNSPQQGIDRLYSQFTGLRVLFERSDAGIELLKRYQTMDPSTINNNDWTGVQKGSYSISFWNIEMLLAQYQIISQFTDSQKSDLISEMLNKYQAKLNFPDTYSSIHKNSTAWVIGRALQQAEYESFISELASNTELQRFLKYGSFVSDSDFEFIVSQAKQFQHDKSSN